MIEIAKTKLSNKIQMDENRKHVRIEGVLPSSSSTSTPTAGAKAAAATKRELDEENVHLPLSHSIITKHIHDEKGEKT